MKAASIPATSSQPASVKSAPAATASGNASEAVPAKTPSQTISAKPAPATLPAKTVPQAVPNRPGSGLATAPTPATPLPAKGSSQPAEVKSTPKLEIAKPEVPKAGHVSFQLLKPGARAVFVAGSFNDWKPEKAPLSQVGTGRWVGDLSVKPGRHEYLFVVDGEWLPDPSAQETVENPFGGRNSVLTVSE